MLQYNRTAEITQTLGTGTVTLAGAIPGGYQSFFVAADGSDEAVTYGILDPQTDEWEVGLGFFNAAAGTLSRTVVYDSSDGGTAVSLQAGDKIVYSTLPSAGPMELQAGSATTTPLLIRGAASQSADIVNVSSASGDQYLRVRSSGGLELGSGSLNVLAKSGETETTVQVSDDAGVTLGIMRGYSATGNVLFRRELGLGTALLLQDGDAVLNNLSPGVPPATTSVLTRGRGDARYVGSSGAQTMQGPLTVSGTLDVNGGGTSSIPVLAVTRATAAQAPATASALTRKDYVDARVGALRTNAQNDSRFVQRSGDSMTGGLSMGSAGAPGATNLSRHLDIFGGDHGLNVSSGNMHAVSAGAIRVYTGGSWTYTLEDDGGSGSAPSTRTVMSRAKGDARYLNLTGGTMSGHISYGVNPTSNNHLARKGYVDGQVGALRTNSENDSRFMRYDAPFAAAAALASIGATAVGAYVTCRYMANGLVANLGGIVGGALLRPSNADGEVRQSGLPGAWMCCGYATGNNGVGDDRRATTDFRRVS